MNNAKVLISEQWPEWATIHPRILAKIDQQAGFDVMGVFMVDDDPVYKLIQYNAHYPQGIILECPIRYTIQTYT